MEFERSRTRVRSVALISLIDIMFFILLFFMFSTSFLHNESMEFSFLHGSRESDSESLRIYISGDGSIVLDERTMVLAEFDEEARKRLIIDPGKKIRLLSDETASVQQLVSALDSLYRHGGKNISISKWIKPSPAPAMGLPDGI